MVYFTIFAQVKYREEYEKNKGSGFSQMPETHEMALSKELRPVVSKKLYEEKSKEMQKNVTVGSGKLVCGESIWKCFV